MKNVLIKIILALYLLSFSWIGYMWNTYAAEPTEWWITVYVTEKVPWAKCVKDEKLWDTQMYKCTVAKGFTAVTEMMWKIIKYFTYIAGLGGVLFIVVNGILYSMWWAEPSMKDEAKKRIIWTLIWLTLLFLSWIILNLIAPWIYQGWA